MDFIFLALWTLCIVVIFVILRIVHNYYDIRQKLKHIPSTPGYLFIGDTLELMNKADYERIDWFLKFMEQNCKEGIFVQWIGTKPFINVYKPEYLEIFFT